MGGDDFNEDDHPRDEGGKFTGGAGVLSAADKPVQKDLTAAEHKARAKKHDGMAKSYRGMGLNKLAEKHAAIADEHRSLATPSLSKEQVGTFAKYGEAKTQGGKSVKDVLTHMRENHMEDSTPEHGFAQATTDKIAAGMGIKKGQALKLLQKAAKEGHLNRRGHEKNFGGANAEKAGFGHQIWEYPNSKKMPD